MNAYYTYVIFEQKLLYDCLLIYVFYILCCYRKLESWLLPENYCPLSASLTGIAGVVVEWLWSGCGVLVGQITAEVLFVWIKPKMTKMIFKLLFIHNLLYLNNTLNLKKGGLIIM